MVTVYEFLRMMVTSAQSRAEFNAEPRAFLDQAGLHELSNADVVHAASLALDHAPVEIVDEFTRALPPGLITLAAEGHGVPLADLMPFLPNGPDDMESNMATPEIFTSLGDVEDMLTPTTRTTDAESTDNSGNSTEMSRSEDTAFSDNQAGAPVGNGNEVGLVGDINTGDISGLTGDLNAGNVAGNGVTDVVGGLEDTVGGVQGGDLTGGLQDLGGVDGGDVTGQLEDVTGSLPVDDVVGGVAPMADLTAPLTGADGPVGGVEGTLGDLTGGLGI
ncbi:hypothetical protein [Saccharopolyspora gloriosae]|uniref:hypothetical protein n=1 Tax=Saccharopolyspora gloriosae TaxID=455344 RepID=UPI001FB72FC5|nr:hypothetical protein [Saccharopolyspora gloriosae]